MTMRKISINWKSDGKKIHVIIGRDWYAIWNDHQITGDQRMFNSLVWERQTEQRSENGARHSRSQEYGDGMLYMHYTGIANECGEGLTYIVSLFVSFVSEYEIGVKCWNYRNCVENIHYSPVIFSIGYPRFTCYSPYTHFKLVISIFLLQISLL